MEKEKDKTEREETRRRDILGFQYKMDDTLKIGKFKEGLIKGLFTKI